jgi:hypothetical protein
MISLSSYQETLLFSFKWYHNISMKKTTQATADRPGRPTKMTGRQARPKKTYDRHRQAVRVYSLS